MNMALITGSTGLLGSEAVEFFTGKGFLVVGVDNDMRQYFFGQDASTRWKRDQLKENIKIISTTSATSAIKKHCNGYLPN